MYRRADVVAVPLKDVWQPTGYSVTLQAMACGKAVVLSNIKGLWDPEVFRSGENCILVEPGNPAALGTALEQLHADPALRQIIGAAARQTAVEAFALSRMNRSIRELVETVRLGPRNRLAS
jgi:glycosyltransferase involved in cell wall biosynthesis